MWVKKLIHFKNFGTLTFKTSTRHHVDIEWFFESSYLHSWSPPMLEETNTLRWSYQRKVARGRHACLNNLENCCLLQWPLCVRKIFTAVFLLCWFRLLLHSDPCDLWCSFDSTGGRIYANPSSVCTGHVRRTRCRLLSTECAGYFFLTKKNSEVTSLFLKTPNISIFFR